MLLLKIYFCFIKILRTIGYLYIKDSKQARMTFDEVFAKK